MMSIQLNPSQCAVLWGTAIVVATFAVMWLQHRRANRNKVPSKWRQVGEIGELIMYPLKSGRGFELQEAECTEMGLMSTDKAPKELQNLRDRFFMVFNEANRSFVTCRNYSSLLLVKTYSVAKDIFMFEAPDVSQLQVKIPDVSSASQKKKISIWHDQQLDTLDCGDEAAAWITSYLKKEGTSLRLGYYMPEDPTSRRDITIPPMQKIKNYYKNLRKEDTGAFSDFGSFMLLSEASVADLKSKLSSELQKIPPKQFRPNFVVKGTKPYEEDGWDWVKIGDSVVLRGVKPCTRCAVVTMDPETGVRESKMEPFITLKKYRVVKDPAAKKIEGDAPVMGLYVGLYNTGLVKVGDPVYVGC